MTLGDGILSKIKEVPMLSPSALRLMEVVGDTSHTVTDVVRIVECDTVLTAHVLKKINSVATGLVSPIETVDRAVAYLGDKMIVSLAIDCCAPQVFGSGLQDDIQQRILSVYGAILFVGDGFHLRGSAVLVLMNDGRLKSSSSLTK